MTPEEDAILTGRIRRPEPVPPADDRDPRGRFQPGCRPGPGRPPGSRAIDLRQVAAAAAEASGIDLHRLLWQVVQSLAEAATAGDVGAARLLIDRLCGREALPVTVEAMSLEQLVLASNGEVVHDVAYAGETDDSSKIRPRPFAPPDHDLDLHHRGIGPGC